MNIAVSMGVFREPKHGEARDALSHDWTGFLDQLEVSPVLVLNRLARPDQLCREMNVCGILLTSGNDVGRCPDEEWQPSDSVFEERDQTEYTLVRYAVENRVPLMGVCRGMQLINTYFGGTLIRDVALWTEGEKHVATDHRVRIVDPSYRQRLGVDSFFANSYHNHGVTPGTLADALKAIATSDAGVVEALHHPELRIMGMQWHPERVNPDPPTATRLFREWLGLCADFSRAGAAEVMG